MNPFTLLGVPFNATKEDVTAAYRQLAKKCHPDINQDDPEAAERFKALSEAYRTLVDEIDARGRRDTRPPPKRGAPTVVTVRRNVFLTVHEAITGCRKRVEGISGPCSGCSGSGRVPSPGPVECTACLGTGVGYRRQSGFIKLRVECADCSGTGRVTWFKCHECAGFGNVHMDSCDVDIPPGTRSGEQLVIPGGADDRRENVVGDVEITVVVKDPKFKITGNDIETAVIVDIWDAVLGTSTDVMLPSGEVCRLEIPPETPHGGRFRIKGRGLHYTEEKGDLVVTLKTRTLKLADAGVRQAMEALRDGSRASRP
ncbi:DnaJ domain-containing protein [Sinorhizobium meliloti]|nr:DnaJ domain-containing protein [Sinorhizobium meliloti]